MKEEILDILNKTYDNLNLRQNTVPLFMSNPGVGKSKIIKGFAKERNVKMRKITLSQRMPNEVAGGVMPSMDKGVWEVLDNAQLSELKDGDILFFDEVFNGTLKQTLDAVLNLLEDRTLPSGKKLADIMIIAASNPQGLINITPQIKERFIRYDLVFDANSYKNYLKDTYGIPSIISSMLCSLIYKEKFEPNTWNYITPRSVEKAINQIACELKSPHDDLLLPILKQEIESPMDLKSLSINKGDKVEFLTLFKEIIKYKNDNKNKK